MNQDRRSLLKHFGSAAAALALHPGAGVKGAEVNRPRIKVAQIGVGHAHASKLSVYRASSDYEVVGICEPDESLRSQAQARPEYRELSWLTQEQLLDVPGLQAVLIETQVRDLLPTAEACVAAGKHIHLDKPAGESLPQFKRILDSAAEQKRLVQLGYMYRYNPGFILLRNLLNEGWLGAVFEVHAVMSKVVAPAMRLELCQYRGGMLFELGCHLVDQVIAMLGRPSDVASYNQHVSTNSDTLLDNMLAVLVYPAATATIRSTAMEVEGFARRHFVVCGTEGTFHIQPLDNPSVRVALSTPREQYRSGYQEIVLPKFQPYVGDALDMALIIRGEKAPDFSCSHDLTVQMTLLKACGMPLDS